MRLILIVFSLRRVLHLFSGYEDSKTVLSCAWLDVYGPGDSSDSYGPGSGC